MDRIELNDVAPSVDYTLVRGRVEDDPPEEEPEIPYGVEKIAVSTCVLHTSGENYDKANHMLRQEYGREFMRRIATYHQDLTKIFMLG